MFSAAVRVSFGEAPVGDVAAYDRLLHASDLTSVTHPASKSASVAKFAIVGVWLLLSGSCMALPHPPVSTSTKLGTLPAAMRRPSAWPLSAAPSRNCALVQTEATVVNSLMVTFSGALFPSTARRAMAGLLSLLPLGMPPVATI